MLIKDEVITIDYEFKEPEIWEPVENFKNVINGDYLISNYGNVKEISTDRILNKYETSNKKHPYYTVMMRHTDGYKKKVLVHQLVAEFFCKKPIKEAMEGVELVPDHLDNNGLNNFYRNLKWKTRAQNIKDAFKMGFIDYRGENARDAIITNEEVEKICQLLENDISYDDIIEEMNFPDTKSYRTLLVRIKNKHAWKVISDNYNIDSNKLQLNSKQRDVVEKLPLIRRYFKDGYSNVEIFNMLWGNAEGISRQAKMVTLRNLRKNKIYQNY